MWFWNAVKTRILTENAEWINGFAELDAKKLKIGDVVQFIRFGFCRLDKKGKDALEFWFTHK